ncbi:MAG: hypothetical protein LC634_03510 [Sphingomonadales bacterium]|nr:hypothetical protein [Sphingomonadales bacterium]
MPHKFWKLPLRMALAPLGLILAALVAQPAEARWFRAETPNFIFYSESSAEETREKAETLEKFDQLLRMFTAVEEEWNGPKFRVFEVDSASDVSRRFHGLAAGVYYGSLRGAFAVVPRKQVGFHRIGLDPQEVLFHEYTHHYMLQYFPGSYPAWYTEGFAEFFATVRFLPDGKVEIGYPQQRHVPFLTEPGDWIDYEDLMNGRVGATYMAYAQGWLLVHFASFNQPAREAIAAYLEAMRDGADAEQAYEQEIATLDWSLHGAVRRYYRNDEVPVRTAEIEFEPVGEIEVRELSEREADIALVYGRIGNAYGGTVRSVADDYSDDPQAQAELAHFLIADRDYDNAIEAGRRAVELDSDHVEGNAMLGAALVLAALESGDAGDARWAEGRAFLLRSNRLDPYYPPALYYYYRSFPPAAAKPENAIAALEQAYRFMPQNYEARTALAIEFLGQSRFDLARLMILPVINSLHHDYYELFAERVFEQIEARNSDIGGLLADIGELDKPW